MAVQPKRYEELKPFLVWWFVHWNKCTLPTPESLVDSLEVQVFNGKWGDHLTAWRRLRQDARLRVARRFYAEVAQVRARLRASTKPTVSGPKEPQGELLLVAKATMQKLLNDDAHRSKQINGLQQRGTELLEELRIYRGLKLTGTQKAIVHRGMTKLRKELQKKYGSTHVGNHLE